MTTPDHYNAPVTPWDLQRHMKTCGNVFADARRADAIKYAHRIKDDVIGDLRKGAHCLLEAATELEKQSASASFKYNIVNPVPPFNPDKPLVTLTTHAQAESDLLNKNLQSPKPWTKVNHMN